MVKPWVKYEEKAKDHGLFIAEPLNKGYGTTLGNSLRRILLSSIGGAAVTAVRIDGADHEFATINGVKEDVLDIIANIKTLAVKSHSAEPKEVTIKAKGKGTVTAKDIDHDDEVVIINPKHHIATLTADSSKLNITLTIEQGEGYMMADSSVKKRAVSGVIPIDASFTPIVKVNHKVEPTRVGKSIDYDRLTIEVWTNGAVSAEEAVQQSASILKEQMEYLFKAQRKQQQRLCRR